MSRMLIAGALTLYAAGQVLAADLPPAPPPPPRAPAAYIPVMSPVYNWGGIYVGINGGWGFGTSNWTATGGTTGDFDISGGLVGGTLGANFQSGPFVFGVEGDIDLTDINGSPAIASCPNAVACQTSNDWLGTIRGRVGYAFNRILVYGTAGGAFGDVKATVTGVGSNDNTEFGWTAGGGIEGAISENWTARVEYLFVDLGNGSCSTACGSSTSPAAVKFETSLIRAGLNFKFGGF
jgi:outer membrane immunogenic protein